MASKALGAYEELASVRFKANPRKELAQVSLVNTEIVDDVIKLAEKLARKKQNTDASRLVEIAQKILANNKRLQNTVGRIAVR